MMSMPLTQSATINSPSSVFWLVALTVKQLKELAINEHNKGHSSLTEDTPQNFGVDHRRNRFAEFQPRMLSHLLNKVS